MAKDLPESPCLMSIPGFGSVVSSIVIGTIGDPHRFEKGTQVLKTAGYDLSADRTGKRTDSVPIISKRGKADLRYALYQAAFSALLRNRHFIRYYTAKIEGRQRERGIAWLCYRSIEIFKDVPPSSPQIAAIELNSVLMILSRPRLLHSV